MYKNFFVHSVYGEILRSGTCADIDFLSQAGTGEFVVEGAAKPGVEYFDGVQLVNIPPKPGESFLFDYVMRVWVDQRTVAELQKAAHDAIEQWRDAQENAGTLFEHDGHTWDCGLKTRERLQPVLALPALPPGFFWTDAENVDVPVTLAELQSLNAAHEAAMVARGFAIHIRQREMKAAILEMDVEQLTEFVPDWEPEE